MHWYAQQDIRCLPLLITPCLVALGQGLSLNQKLTVLARLGSQQGAGIRQSLLLLGWGCRHAHPCLFFDMGEWNQTHVLIL